MPNTLSFDSIKTDSLEGNITLTGNMSATGSINSADNSTFSKDLNVGGNLSIGRSLNINNDLTITGTLYADKLVTKTVQESKDPFTFTTATGRLEGTGLMWRGDNSQVDVLIYRTAPNRIFSSLDIDLLAGKTYRIDGVEIINPTSLGGSIINSKLRTVGTLTNLTVSGSANIGDHLFYNEKTERIGVGTDSPNAALSVVDNNVEIILGSLREGRGHIGTFTSNDLEIITDNVVRMSIARTGKIVIGNPVAQNADVEIQGKLFVRQLIVDQTDSMNTPLEFKAASGGTNYGRGMIFTGSNSVKQFILSANPDNFLSTEHMNLASSKNYLINGIAVLTSSSLGSGVTSSNLKELGTLNKLNVADTLLVSNGVIVVSEGTTISGNITIGNTTQNINISDNNISLGTKDQPSTNAIVNGSLTVGVQTIGSNAQFEVAGNIRFANRLFAVDVAAPSTGSFRKGDIVWNSNPVEGGIVGWVCVMDGSPGLWRGFGQIGLK